MENKKIFTVGDLINELMKIPDINTPVSLFDGSTNERFVILDVEFIDESYEQCDINFLSYTRHIE